MGRVTRGPFERRARLRSRPRACGRRRGWEGVAKGAAQSGARAATAGSLGCYSRHRASAARCCSSSSARCSARGVRGPAGASAALYAAFLSTRWRSACGGLGRALGVGTRSSRAPPAPPASRRLVERDNLALRRLNLGVELVALPLQLVSLLRRLDDEVRLPRDSRDTAETQPKTRPRYSLDDEVRLRLRRAVLVGPEPADRERGGQVRAHTRWRQPRRSRVCESRRGQSGIYGAGLALEIGALGREPVDTQQPLRQRL